MKSKKSAARGAAPAAAPLPPPQPSAHTWTFLSNHSHVLICLCQQPDLRLRDVALRVGLTERAVQRIVQELEEGGVVTRQKAGRRNTYDIDLSVPLRHAVEAHRTVGDLIAAVLTKEEIARIPRKGDA